MMAKTCGGKQQPLSSSKRRPSTTATFVDQHGGGVDGGGDDNKRHSSSPTTANKSSHIKRHSTSSHSNRSQSKMRKRPPPQQQRQQQQLLHLIGRRLAVPLMTFLLVFIWVLGIVALCQHRRNLTSSSTTTTTGQVPFLRHGKQHQPLLLWNNNNNGIVHVIQTRFMQYQGHLLQLGRARLKLFEAITLPSVIHQTTTAAAATYSNNNDISQFLWIIRTDPNLAPELRARLIQLVEPYQFIVLVGSNENPEGFRGQDCIADMIPNTTTTTENNHSPIVWSGRLETVRSYYQAAQSHTVLETRLDADDGLLLDFVRLVQVDAARRFQTNNNSNNNDNWMVWCAKNHMEWQYASPWTTTMTTTNADKNADTDDQGGLVGLKSKHCVTAGLTFGYGVGSSPTQIPSHKHQQLHEAIPACDTTGSAHNRAIRTTTRCLARIEPPGNLPAVIRARTPTSAGMEHVLTGLANVQDNKLYLQKVKGSGWKDSQHALFHELPKLFGIQPFALWNVRAFIKRYLPEILLDNFVGQCTKGHSCKEESKKLLQQLLEESTAK